MSQKTETMYVVDLLTGESRVERDPVVWWEWMTDANLRIFHVAFRDREVAILVNPLQQGDPDTHRLFEVLYRETDLVELTGYRTLNEALTHAHFLEAWHGRDD